MGVAGPGGVAGLWARRRSAAAGARSGRRCRAAPALLPGPGRPRGRPAWLRAAPSGCSGPASRLRSSPERRRGRRGLWRHRGGQQAHGTGGGAGGRGRPQGTEPGTPRAASCGQQETQRSKCARPAGAGASSGLESEEAPARPGGAQTRADPVEARVPRWGPRPPARGRGQGRREGQGTEPASSGARAQWKIRTVKETQWCRRGGETEAADVTGSCRCPTGSGPAASSAKSRAGTWRAGRTGRPTSALPGLQGRRSRQLLLSAPAPLFILIWPNHLDNPGREVLFLFPSHRWERQGPERLRRSSTSHGTGRGALVCAQGFGVQGTGSLLLHCPNAALWAGEGRGGCRVQGRAGGQRRRAEEGRAGQGVQGRAGGGRKGGDSCDYSQTLPSPSGAEGQVFGVRL